jgi:uncharacterized membrane protein SpoIIM required for sporulation
LREPLFIKKNKDKWEYYDTNPTLHPDELSDRFTNILDDLAYAQTFYPKGTTVQYLNERAVVFYNQIYKKKKVPFSSLLDFWRVDLPLMLYKNRRFLYLSTFLFLLMSFIGFVSTQRDDGFMDIILGSEYREMTEENMSNGQPFHVYSNENTLDMFFRIGMNNIRLAFIMDFIGGIPLCIVSLYSLFTNSIMFGSFFYLFFSHDFGWDFYMVVMMHGTFEMFGLVLACAAGFRLFNSLVYVGTYTRWQSIKFGFKEGAQMMILVLLLTTVAAYLESYVTRLAAAGMEQDHNRVGIPYWLTAVLQFLMTGLIIWYFYIYPIWVSNMQLKKMNKLIAASNFGKVTIDTNHD